MTLARGGEAAEEIAAESILRAAGSSLRYHTMPSGRQAILAAARAALQKARAEERERCAKVAEQCAEGIAVEIGERSWPLGIASSLPSQCQELTADAIAAAIRALPESDG